MKLNFGVLEYLLLIIIIGILSSAFSKKPVSSPLYGFTVYKKGANEKEYLPCKFFTNISPIKLFVKNGKPFFAKDDKNNTCKITIQGENFYVACSDGIKFNAVWDKDNIRRRGDSDYRVRREAATK